LAFNVPFQYKYMAISGSKNLWWEAFFMEGTSFL